MNGDSIMKTRTGSKIVKIAVIIVILLSIALICFVGYKKYIGKDYINYQETSDIDYSVCFKQPNDFYDQECLPQNINNYITKYIDYININFDYKLNLNKEVDTTYKYTLTGELTIFDRNNNAHIMNRKDYSFINKKEIADENVDEVKLSELIRLNYDEYDMFVTNFRNNANVPIGANLKIILHIETSNKHSKVSESIKTNNDIVINIPLGESTTQFDTNFQPIYESPNIEIKTNQTLMNITLKVLAIISGTMGIMLFIVSIIIINNARKRIPVYKRFINELKNDYDYDISNITNLIDTDEEDTYTYFNAANFKELYEFVKTSDDKKILWNEKKYHDKNGRLKNRISWFFVFMSETKVMRFIVDENVLTKEYEDNPDILKKYRG